MAQGDESKGRRTKRPPKPRRGSDPREISREAAGVESRPSASEPPQTKLARVGRPTAGRATTPRSTPDQGNIAVDTHRVQAGDTFASLALQYYGHERHTQFLVRSNPEITDPRRLAIGSTIMIPPLPTAHTEAESSVAKASSPAPAPASGGHVAPGRTYEVKPGDSFYRIARVELGDASKWEDLFSLNKELVQGDPKQLQVGQVLRLPTR